MPKALARFRSGQSVSMECYRRNCEGATVNGVLGNEETEEIHPGFHGNERITWEHGTTVRSFRLTDRKRCPCCNTEFAKAIIVSRGRLIKPTIMGYESEPA